MKFPHTPGDEREEMVPFKFYDDNIDRQGIENAIRLLLLATGHNLEHPELKDTPARVTRFWTEFLEYDEGNLGTAFDHHIIDQMVMVKGIKFHSLCAHHLLPIIGTCSVAYLTNNSIVGLSKIPRVVQSYAHELITQEKMADKIANLIEALTESENVAVYIEADHLCMQMRGIKSEGKMITSIMRGAFRDTDLRQEFLTLCK